MTLEIIRDYFLRVGASFRESLAWRSEFMSAKGTSEVLRTGYFGVGALAGFLVGEQINVSTRHVTSEEALEFSTTIDRDPIQIRRIKRPVGTTITIPLRKDLKERGWRPHVRYYLKRPSVAGVDVPVQFYPDVNDSIPPRWQKLRDPKRPVVMWARGLPEYYAERVTHNGFMVEHGDQQPKVIWQDQFYGLRLFCPFLHILDFEGNQQRPYLNLARTDFILDRFEHAGSLFGDMLRDYLAYLIVTCLESGLSPMLKPAREYRYVDLRLTGLNRAFSADAHSVRGRSWVYTKGGIALLDAEILNNLEIKTVLIGRDDIVLQWVSQDTGTAASIPQSSLTHLHGHVTASNVEILYPGKGFPPPPARLNVRGSEAITIKRSAPSRQLGGRLAPKVEFEGYSQSGTPEYQFMAGTFESDAISGRPAKLMEVFNSLDEVCRSARQKAFDEERVDGPESSTMVAWSLAPLNGPQPTQNDMDSVLRAIAMSLAPSRGPSPLAVAWDRYIGEPIIPYDLSLRRKKLSHAYKALGHYIRAWEELLADKAKDL
jgi:hypothetical protein